MMKKARLMQFFALLIFGVWAASCGQTNRAEQQAEQQKAKSEVMSIHDEVMPKNGYLLDLKDSVSALLATNPSDSAIVLKSQSLLAQLETAYQSMDNWMKNFEHKDMQPDVPHEEVIAYFASQRDSIAVVKKLMLESISATETFLQEQPKTTK